MVAVADVIKKMQAEGMDREQVIESLNELGFPNAAELYDKNAGPQARQTPATPKPTALQPKPGGLLEAAEREEAEEKRWKRGESEESGAGETEKPLFGQPAKKQEEAEETEEKQEEVPESEEELTELKITQVGDDGLEKTVSIEDMLTKAGSAGSSAAPSAGTTPSITDSSLRAKLEETNALLKALADVNKKILETDREVLMRLKARETQAKEPQKT